MDDPPWARVVVYQPRPDAARRMLDEARDADLIVKASGVGVLDDLLEAEVLERRTSSNAVVFWDVDAPATLDRVHRNPDDYFAQLIPRYDAILTYGGGEPVRQAYLALGARQCEPVYNALDPISHFPVEPDPRFSGDLGFLGNRLPDRESRVEEFFLKAASLASGATFLLGGAGWEGKPMSANVRSFGHVFTRDHNAFHSTPRMALNISRDSMARYGFSPATRVFEAAGAGACLITDAWRGIEQFLDPGSEILVAGCGAEVACFVQSVSPSRAAAIGREAHRRVLAEHTYAHRAAQLDAMLGASLWVGAAQ
jgi:spore maturation protein CgeB